MITLWLVSARRSLPWACWNSCSQKVHESGRLSWAKLILVENPTGRRGYRVNLSKLAKNTLLLFHLEGVDAAKTPFCLLKTLQARGNPILCCGFSRYIFRCWFLTRNPSAHPSSFSLSLSFCFYGSYCTRVMTTQTFLQWPLSNTLLPRRKPFQLRSLVFVQGNYELPTPHSRYWPYVGPWKPDKPLIRHALGLVHCAKQRFDLSVPCTNLKASLCPEKHKLKGMVRLTCKHTQYWVQA